MSAVIDLPSGPSVQPPKIQALWSWLRGVLLPPDGGRGDQVAVMPAPSLVPATLRAVPPSRASVRDATGVILPFPIHGEALLVKLADVLRARIADRGPEQDPLLLQMSRSPRSRLTVDRKAYIEFHDDRCEYRAVIEASQETKVILETADFDALVDFVLQYLVGRLAETAALEAAP